MRSDSPRQAPPGDPELCVVPERARRREFEPADAGTTGCSGVGPSIRGYERESARSFPRSADARGHRRSSSRFGTVEEDKPPGLLFGLWDLWRSERPLSCRVPSPGGLFFPRASCSAPEVSSPSREAPPRGSCFVRPCPTFLAPRLQRTLIQGPPQSSSDSGCSGSRHPASSWRGLLRGPNRAFR